MGRERTKYQGVYQRLHSVRRHLGKPDVCFDITYKTPDGKKVWEKVGWASEEYNAQMAAQIRAERIRAMRHGEALPVRKRSMSFAEAWEVYKKEWLCQVKTAAEDTRRYEAYLKKPLADKPVAAITPLDLERVKTDMAGKGYSPQTIKHALGLVRRVYRKLNAWGLFTGKPPTDNVAMPRLEAARTRYLTADEAKKLLADLKKRSRFWHDAALLSLHTGMRLGEVLGLRWEDVDFDTGILHVRDPGGDTLRTRDAKSGRAAHLSADAAAMLRERGSKPVGFVFTDRNGAQVVHRGATSFTRAVERLGLNKDISDRRQRVVFHSLRHTFASWLAIRGVPLYVIGELLGHKTLEMTKRYSHLCPDVKQGAVALIDGLLRGETEGGEAEGEATHTSSSDKPRDTPE